MIVYLLLEGIEKDSTKFWVFVYILLPLRVILNVYSESYLSS